MWSAPPRLETGVICMRCRWSRGSAIDMRRWRLSCASGIIRRRRLRTDATRGTPVSARLGVLGGTPASRLSRQAPPAVQCRTVSRAKQSIHPWAVLAICFDETRHLNGAHMVPGLNLPADECPLQLSQTEDFLVHSRSQRRQLSAFAGRVAAHSG